MFYKARLKLTAWYLLIIMLISISFSLAIYGVLTNELNRVERVQRQRRDRLIPMEFNQRFPRQPIIDPEVIEETKNRLRAILFIINLGILGSAGVLGYFLAGRTLKPIKEMVDEQNRFITDSSHELRTPLTSLKSEIEVALRDKKLDLADAKKLLQSNLEEVNNLQYLSDNLIKLTQYEKSNGNHFEEVNLSEIVEEAIRKVANLAKNKKITIKNNVKNIKLDGDGQSLVELFVILLDNAIKYSPKGEIVTISSPSVILSEAKDLKISIKDEGIGISEKDLPHLFDRFFRVDKSRTKKGSEGYGLGLSIAKHIADRHGGSIKVESEFGRGTTFSIQLPIKH